MDVAYDHIQEEALNPDAEAEASFSSSTQPTQAKLPTEFQEAFKAVSASPWGATLGGWFSQARKQGETFYNDISKEAVEASTQATKGLTSLREQVAQRTRGVTLTEEAGALSEVPGEGRVPTITKTDTTAAGVESVSTDIVKEAGTLVASLRLTAAAKLKDLQKAEDAADEALLKFGANVRNFLRDAVTISAPNEDDERPRGRDGAGNEVLFETQEPGTGKKVFHSTRLDAQLHAIHTSASSFTVDPQGDGWKSWTEEFDVERRTTEIAGDLEQYEKLRRAMEKLVPEQVDYTAFWMRYYFLRKAIEEEERRRKEVLKGAAAEIEDNVAWDDDDEEESTTPQPQPHAKASESTTTLNAPPASNDLLKPGEGRRSEDENKSVAGSDASYDLVSGATSRAMGSPKESRRDDDESDDDWE